MATAAQPSPQNSYVAVGTFHHPDGVVYPGDTVTLDSGAAERGIDAGTLVPIETKVPETKTPAPEPEPKES